MLSYVTADDQRRIRSELAQVESLLQTVFARLKNLDRRDERVTRTESTIAALQRLLWTMTSGPGRLGDPIKVQPILTIPNPESAAILPFEQRTPVARSYSHSKSSTAVRMIPKAHG